MAIVYRPLALAMELSELFRERYNRGRAGRVTRVGEGAANTDPFTATGGLS